MHLITHCGHRLDRLTALDRLRIKIRATPYRELHDTDKRNLVALQATEHQRREAIRFAPVCEEDVLIRVNVALLMTATRKLESRRKLI